MDLLQLTQILLDDLRTGCISRFFKFFIMFASSFLVKISISLLLHPCTWTCSSLVSSPVSKKWAPSHLPCSAIIFFLDWVVHLRDIITILLLMQIWDFYPQPRLEQKIHWIIMVLLAPTACKGNKYHQYKNGASSTSNHGTIWNSTSNHNHIILSTYTIVNIIK